MSTPQEPQAPEETPDTLEVEAPSGQEPGAPEDGPSYFEDTFDPRTLDENLQRAYKGMQADYTRKTQELAAHRKFFQDLGVEPDDPDAVLRALAEREGYEFDEEEEPSPEWDEQDPLSPLEQRLAALEEERQHERQADADVQSMANDLRTIVSELGRDLTKDEIDALTELAQRDKQGALRLIPGWQAAQRIARQQQQQYRQTKKAPAVTPDGTQGTRTVNLDDADERRDYSAQIIAEHWKATQS